ncbi:MAG TPA: HYR domain-containing protein [Verrucomicrobiae bacterium]|nr:HYR domain-containing protein [Verrucomicrobiae bacterium]
MPSTPFFGLIFFKEKNIVRTLVRKTELLFLCLSAAALLGFTDKKQNPDLTGGFLSPSVTTDQYDYPPGGTVRIIGNGFLPGEGVQLVVEHVDSSVTGGDGHHPWTVAASARGGFVSDWTVPYDDNLGEVLRVRATGQTSRSQATALFVDANTQLSLMTSLPDTLCPGEAIEICANLSQRCGSGDLSSLSGQNLIFYVNAGDCGANVGQAGEDTVETDAQGNACFNWTVPETPGVFSLRIKFQGEQKPNPCPDIGNSACNPADPAANKRCTNLSSSNTCFTFVVDSSACGCQAPVLTCPAFIARHNDPGQCGAVVNYSIQASGECSPITVACVPPTGSFFLVGTTNVVCTATDTAGNASSCSFPVTVQDAEPPQVFCNQNISVTTGPGQTGVPVVYSASTLDNCASSGAVCSPPSGSLFPVGVTTVTCTASDASQNSASCSFTITVNAVLFFQRNGAFAGDQLGFSVAGGGDLNGDGFTDFLVTIPGADVGGAGNSAALPDAGSVGVFSGADGQLLYEINGIESGDRLGGSAGIGGDVNNDGYADFIVGSPDADVSGMVDAGAAYVYSGYDGSVLYKVKGTATADRLGGSAGLLEDINSDNYDEFIICAPGADGGGAGGSTVLQDAGAVYVYSGLDGSLLYQITGEEAANRLGGSLGVGGDVDEDGVEDFIVGTPEADINGMVDAGAAYVYSGKTGQLLYSIYGPAAGDQFGYAVGISGNPDGAGGDDFIVGAPGTDVLSAGSAATLLDAGAAYIYSGSDGTLLHEFKGTEEANRLGGSVGLIEDVDMGGEDDFYIAGPEADPNGLIDAGTMTVYSGETGQPLFQVDGESSGDRLGGSVSIFESLTGKEGITRFLIGAPGADFGTETDAGSAFVYQIAFKGDMNGDGRLAAADVVLLLNCIYLNSGFCPVEIADMNCDGSLISPTDVVILLNATFLAEPIFCVQ